MLSFILARATDRFLSDAEKVENVEHLCDKIEKEFDSANVVIKILSYKLLSPDQNEAHNSLEVGVKNNVSKIF